MMSSGLGVYMVPSRSAEAWRGELARSASVAGWRYEDLDKGASPIEVGSEKVVFVTENADLFEGYPPEKTRVVFWSPEEVVALLRAMDPGGTDAQLIGRASVYLAQADRLIRAGAIGVDPISPSSLHAELGIIRLPAEIVGRIEPHRPAGPLSMYRMPGSASLGQQVRWEPTMFRFPTSGPGGGGRPAISLSGRARPLMHGPFVHLPSGLWRAKCSFSADIEGRGVRLEVHWGEADIDGGSLVDIVKSGSYDLEMEAWIRSDKPAELRITMPNASLYGELEIANVDIELIHLA